MYEVVAIPYDAHQTMIQGLSLLGPKRLGTPICTYEPFSYLISSWFDAVDHGRGSEFIGDL